MHHEDPKVSGAPSMRIAIRNEGPETIEIQGAAPFVYLRPGETHQLTTPKVDVNDIWICCFVAKSRVAVDILSGQPERATISLAAYSSDGP